MKEDERDRLEGALAVVDRWHAAERTVVPSVRAVEKGRRELEGEKVGDRYGVEMKYGLDIEGLLAKGLKEMRSEKLKSQELSTTKSTWEDSMKRKTPETSRIPPKRVCLGNKGSGTENRVSVLEEGRLKSMDDDFEQLLSTATILVASKTYLTEVQAKIPGAVYLDVTDESKENSPHSTPRHNSSDNLVLVNRYNPSIRTVLGMVKRASVLGGRWHVYHWKIVNCMNGDTNTNRRNEYLWTYVNGDVY